jgi:hypothetical protein
MAAKLEKISAISDDAIFAIELTHLADEVEEAATPRPVTPRMGRLNVPRVQGPGKNWFQRPFLTENAAQDFADKHPGTWVEEMITDGKPNGWTVKFRA